MAQTFFPFNSGAGANVSQNQWQLMANLWRSTGVITSYLNDLSVYADGSGMWVYARTGAAWMAGFYFQSDTQVQLAISASDPTNPRLDRIVVHLDESACTISLMVLTGTPASTPALPALTQNSTVWEIPLATVLVAANSYNVPATAVTDARSYSLPAIRSDNSQIVGPLFNTLINGGFDIVQRKTQVYTVGASIAADGYLQDRWRVNGQTNTQTITASQQDGRGVTGLSSYNIGRYTIGVSTGKMTLAQIVEGRDTIPLRGRNVSFQVKLRAGAAATWKVGVFKWNGTIDIVPSYLCSGTWGANSADPTWSTNVTQLAVVTCYATTSIQQVIVQANVPSDANNLIVIVWSDSGMAAATYLDVAEAGLYDGNLLRDWLPRPIGQELSLCQRYCVCYGTDNAYENIGFGLENGGNIKAVIALPVQMRTVPSLVSYGNYADYEAAPSALDYKPLTSAPTIWYASTRVVTISGNHSATANTAASIFMKANNVTSQLVFGAEL